MMHRWVQQLSIQYHAFQEGKQSNLNQDRVDQVLDLGFEFKENTAEPSKAKESIPDIGFDRRLKQLQDCKAEYGHMNIDYRFDRMENFGGWCVQISERHRDWKEGKEIITPLEEGQFNQLSELGFEFNVFPAARSKRSWEENFEAFLEVSKYYIF